MSKRKTTNNNNNNSGTSHLHEIEVNLKMMFSKINDKEIDTQGVEVNERFWLVILCWSKSIDFIIYPYASSIYNLRSTLHKSCI